MKSVCCDKCRQAATLTLRKQPDISGLQGWTFNNWNGSVDIVGLITRLNTVIE